MFRLKIVKKTSLFILVIFLLNRSYLSLTVKSIKTKIYSFYFNSYMKLKINGHSE